MRLYLITNKNPHITNTALCLSCSGSAEEAIEFLMNKVNDYDYVWLSKMSIKDEDGLSLMKFFGSGEFVSKRHCKYIEETVSFMVEKV